MDTDPFAALRPVHFVVTSTHIHVNTSRADATAVALEAPRSMVFVGYCILSNAPGSASFLPDPVEVERARADAAYAAGLAAAVGILIKRAEGRERQGQACLRAQGAYDALCVKANELRAAAEDVWRAIPEAYRGGTPRPEVP